MGENKRKKPGEGGREELGKKKENEKRRKYIYVHTHTMPNDFKYLKLFPSKVHMH